MHQELDRLLSRIDAPTPEHARLRVSFGLVCVGRIAHLIEDPDALRCWRDSGAAAQAAPVPPRLEALALEAAALANRHQGSRSLDGVGHAAVSATYALAKALAAQARQAAQYAAYAAVYAQGGYGAIRDPDSLMPEYQWQADVLRALLADLDTASSDA